MDCRVKPGNDERSCPGRGAALLQRCTAEPGPYQTPAFVAAPALQRTASQELRAALRPGHDYPSIWVSPQIEIAWPEIVFPRGLHMNRIWSASCCGVT